MNQTIDDDDDNYQQFLSKKPHPSSEFQIRNHLMTNQYAHKLKKGWNDTRRWEKQRSHIVFWSRAAPLGPRDGARHKSHYGQQWVTNRSVATHRPLWRPRKFIISAERPLPISIPRRRTVIIANGNITLPSLLLHGAFQRCVILVKISRRFEHWNYRLFLRFCTSEITFFSVFETFPSYRQLYIMHCHFIVM